MFEWCSVQQQIIVGYAEDILMLISIRHNDTGTCYTTHYTLHSTHYTECAASLLLIDSIIKRALCSVCRNGGVSKQKWDSCCQGMGRYNNRIIS